MTKLTREQFIAQFPYETSVEKIANCLIPEECDIKYEGVEIFRALNLLLIRVDGKFYMHG